MVDNLSFDFTSGNSAVHVLTPLSNRFAIGFSQNFVCPLSSVREVIINGRMEFSFSLSSI